MRIVTRATLIGCVALLEALDGATRLAERLPSALRGASALVSMATERLAARVTGVGPIAAVRRPGR